MLALTRKNEEAIIIDGKIKIKILDIMDGKVRIGIEAPKEVSIHREEVYLEIEENNKGSITSNKETLKSLADMIKSNI